MFVSTPAFAQIVNSDELSNAQTEELYCIHSVLVEDANASAVALYAVTGESKHKEASGKAEAAARTACAEKYKWSSEQTDVAASVGVWALVVDAAEADLSRAGFSGEAIGKIFDIANTLTDEDIEKAAREHGDKSGEAIVQRLKAMLVEGGLPDDEMLLAVALVLLDASSNETYAADEWVAKKFY